MQFKESTTTMDHGIHFVFIAPAMARHIKGPRANICDGFDEWLLNEFTKFMDFFVIYLCFNISFQVFHLNLNQKLIIFWFAVVKCSEQLISSVLIFRSFQAFFLFWLLFYSVACCVGMKTCNFLNCWMTQTYCHASHVSHAISTPSKCISMPFHHKSI